MHYITGDTHGDFSEVVRFCKKQKLTENDTVIILGDAGINYYGDSRDRKPREQLSKTPATIFCIHGNHERRPQSMDKYHETTWHDGTVYFEDEFPNILFAKDGEIYDLDGLRTLVVGGAYSIDKFYRLKHDLNWFADEQPDQSTKEYVEAQLDKHSWNVDVVLSHTAPIKYEPTEVFLERIDQSKVDKTTERWLDTIEDKLNYQHWYCGHFHTSKNVDKLQFMYHDFDVLPTRSANLRRKTKATIYDFRPSNVGARIKSRVAAFVALR